MLFKNFFKSALSESDVTDENIYRQRRELLTKMGYLGAGALVSGLSPYGHANWFSGDKKPNFVTSDLTYKAAENISGQLLTSEEKVTTHNNFYEFGSQKHQPFELSQQFKVNPWQLKVSGECDKPFTLDYDDLFKRFELEERIYRLRCVEAWSMVIPWQGFSLANLLKQASPNSKAKYVVFETLHDPEQMPGQANRRLGGGIQYPYTEGLRIDEAMNSLTLLSVGLYGKTLPPQNGAPIRLVVPWKYGFKSIKSIVSIKLVSSPPQTTWNQLAPQEYGFYANVNPMHDHPRWSQATERRITGNGLFAASRINTLPFNGYGEQVAHLYKGMDLHKYY
ncbi:protein-methionine-sulfoxide reductase catalytic subunit MsrP [Colwellia sp. RSH04]|uniref:protein-methionine-sulfoxide reductase catalytic subunit MsrP n=1 Tax=Colwellia sp. RSH04 TaxID=2305464 RepID=UPI000E57F80D|nr:protein-methionine-sulfoxide reductase catalytic subunit MsrP [Colwellia sp. RSH04]RHW75364.1 protein-methionine-sulfoxide reductase catalytic subunit MsrP [Colwellia sp. RSH04]